jgi:hypothetical protein
MKNKTIVYPLIGLAVLIIVSLACGSSNTGVQVGVTTTNPTSAPPQVVTHKIGDIIQVGDSTIVMNSAGIQSNKLSANFTIENKGTSDMNVSSMLSFSAKDSEGTKLTQNIFDCGTGLDGKVLPGDKLKGDICWDGATTDTVKIYYEAELFSSGAIVWEVTK